jgi:hypothetical protein
MAYPAAFVTFSWVRGALDGWYAYDFLNPTLDGGWSAVLVAAAEVLAAFLVVGVLVHAAGNARAALAVGRPPRRGAFGRLRAGSRAPSRTA